MRLLVGYNLGQKVLIQPDFNIVFSGEGGVFVVASAFQSFILKPDMVTSTDFSQHFCPRLYRL